MTQKEIILLVFLILTGAAFYLTNTLPHSPNPLLLPATYSAQVSNCHGTGGLPDPACTPGSADPRVTQDNINQTICVTGYTKSVRPPVSYTEPLKMNLMSAYGYSDSPSDYELDHLIPLEVGGNPTDQKNLWPEPGLGQYNFHNKDSFENYLHRQVCSGSLSLQEAQTEIATNWVKYWLQDGSP